MRRFWVGFALILPVFLLEMGGHIPALRMHDLDPPQISTWVQFALSTPVVLFDRAGSLTRTQRRMTGSEFTHARRGSQTDGFASFDAKQVNSEPIASTRQR